MVLEIKMRIIFTSFLFVVCFLANAQEFKYSDNLRIEQITEENYNKASQKSKSHYKMIYKGKKYKHIRSILLSSNIGKHLYELWDSTYIDESFLGYYEFPTVNGKNVLVLETQEPIVLRAYLMDSSLRIDTISMFGCGELCANGIYYSRELFDCDDIVWCRWYSIKDGYVKTVAELKENTFEYEIPYDTTSLFTYSNAYYLTILHKLNHEKKYYKIYLIE